MKKMLMVATVPSMIGQFNMSNIQILQEMGYEVHVACDIRDRSVWNEEKIRNFKENLMNKNIQLYQIDFSRNALKIWNHIRAYKQLLNLVEKEQYNLIHCHTPIAGALSRLVCHNTSIKCIYTAHGFHFFKGAPLKNWLLFYPMEKWCSKYTDALVTINTEDYKLAKSKFKAKQVYYIPGVGVDTKEFMLDKYDKISLREEFNVPPNAKVLLSIGELNKNKNHQLVIKALSEIGNKNIYYIIAGSGGEEHYLNRLINKLHLQNQIKLLGYYKQVKKLYAIADAFIFPSYREGLSVALMEAISTGLPIACSKIRGNVDLVDDDVGCLFEPNNIEECKNAIIKLEYVNIEQIKEHNYKKIKSFDIGVINKMMKKVYLDI